MEPKFKIGDHITCNTGYWGKQSGVIVESLGLIHNADGPMKDNFVHRFKSDTTGSIWTESEKKMKTFKQK